MAEILTSKYKQDLLRNFFLETQENANTALTNEFYMMVGNNLDSFGNKITSVNAQGSESKFMNTILFGKKVAPTDVKIMFKYNPWQEGTVFDEYDDQVNLSDKKFICVVGPNLNKTGDYRVFKCLNNNGGAAVQTHPEYDITNEDQIYSVLTDGYVWKYMFRITAAQFEAYNAVGYIPIMGDFILDPFDTANSAALPTTTGSPINKIELSNGLENFGYPAIYEGSVYGVNKADNIVTVETPADYRLSQIQNYYAGMTMSIVLSGPQTVLWEISKYVYDTGSGRGLFTLKGQPVINSPGARDTANVELTQEVSITPTVIIEGDGTGCEAVSIVEDEVITGIKINSSGDGYHNATATIKDPLYDFDPDDPLTVDVRATLRPILSPKGGHGTDLIAELEAKRILMYAYINETNNSLIGATNTFNTVGLIKNPTWANTSPNYTSPETFDNRIAVTTDSSYDILSVDTLVTQVDANNDVIFSGKIHEVDETSNTFYISEYIGPYVNNPDSTSQTSLNLSYPLLTLDGTAIQINTPIEDNVVESPYVQRSGVLYFMEDITPLTRTDQSREEYKLVLEF